MIKRIFLASYLLFLSSCNLAHAQIATLEEGSRVELNSQLRYSQRRVDSVEQFLDAKIFDINGGTMDGVQIGGTTATGELIVNDASDDADGLGSQGTSGQFLQSAGAGANPVWASTKPVFAAASGTTNYLIAGPAGDGGTGGSSYVKILSLYVDGSGTISTTFWLSHDSGGTGYGQIYRNGSSVGTQRSVASGGRDSFSQDISGWSPGDTAEVWAYCTAGNVSVGGFILGANIPTSNYDPYSYTTSSRRYFGSKTPSNVWTVAATGNIGDYYTDTSGGASTTLYIKTASTTWTAK